MKDIDLQYVCRTIGDLSGIPIRLYQDAELKYYYSVVHLPRDPILADHDAIWEVKEHVGYFMTEEFSFYGVVNSGKTKIIVGPTGHIPGGDQELRTLAFRADVPRSEIDSFLRGMKSIVPMPLESVLKMLCTVNYILNDEKLELQDITIHETDQMNLKTATESHRVNSTESGRTEVHHNTLAVEEALMNLISHGDTAALREWIAAAPSVRGGTLAADQLRQRKNTFIVTATLSSRAAIRGGMDPNDALSLSDRFIQRSELADTPNKLTNLQYHMVLEFTERVERIRKGGNPTKLTMAVANYVQHHLSEPVTAEDIAKELYLSRPYLSAKFKKNPARL